MDDSRAGFPETETVLEVYPARAKDRGERKEERDSVRSRSGRNRRAYLGRCGGKEIVNLPVNLVCARQILHSTNLSLDKMVTVDCCWNSSGVHASGHELENGHLWTRR